MPYIGTSPSNGVRRVFTYTATASQTTFSGASNEGSTLAYVDNNYLDVFQNGILLGSADYTSTNGTSVVLAQAASVNDIIVIVAYDVFSVADTVSKTDGGTFDSAVTMANNLTVSGAFTSQGIDDNADATSLTIDTSENVTLNSGNIIFGTASKGIYLGVTSATASNLLDDYEEGTFTHSLTNTGATINGGFTLGTYVKVGALVFVCGAVVYGSGTASSQVFLSGLPFANAVHSRSHSVMSFEGTVAGTTVSRTARISPSSTTVPTSVSGGTGGSNLVYMGMYSVV